MVVLEDFRAANGARTRDLFVTNEMLYQLSYCGCCDASWSHRLCRWVRKRRAIKAPSACYKSI